MNFRCFKEKTNRSLFAVVANGFYGTSFQSFIAKLDFFIVLGLPGYVGVSFIFVSCKDFRSSFAAKIAINAAAVYVIFPRGVAHVFIIFICHGNNVYGLREGCMLILVSSTFFSR